MVWGRWQRRGNVVEGVGIVGVELYARTHTFVGSEESLVRWEKCERQVRGCWGSRFDVPVGEA